MFDVQSASDAHAVLHELASSQTRPPAHGVGLPGLQAPYPSQVFGANDALEQVEPHVVPDAGYSQAPVPTAQPVVAQAPTPAGHADAQQTPLPPQAPLTHWPPAAQPVAPTSSLAWHTPAPQNWPEVQSTSNEHGPHTPAAQNPLLHSPAPVQCSPLSHAVQAPPQSTSVSIPFWAPSSHAGALQVCRLALQTWPTQSAPCRHLRSTAQGLHAPPQSASVSVPFWMPSAQLAGTQACAPQTREAQSDPSLHSTQLPAPSHIFAWPVPVHATPIASGF
jgi:hypothetical protein